MDNEPPKPKPTPTPSRYFNKKLRRLDRRRRCPPWNHQYVESSSFVLTYDDGNELVAERKSEHVCTKCGRAKVKYKPACCLDEDLWYGTLAPGVRVATCRNCRVTRLVRGHLRLWIVFLFGDPSEQRIIYDEE